MANKAPDFRHTCEQNEGMAGYGWEEYDARNGGREVIHDSGNQIDLTIDFVKVPGGNHGGSWAARVKGTTREDAPPNMVTTVLFYAGLEGLGQLGVANEPSDVRYAGPVTLHGQTSDLGEFDIEVEDSGTNSLPYRVHESWDTKPLDGTLVGSFRIPPEQVWRAKDIMFAGMKQTIDAFVAKYGEETMPPAWQAFTIPMVVEQANMHMLQKVFVGNFQFDILFKSASGPDVTQDTLSDVIEENSKNFKSRFQDVFKLQKPFNNPDHAACAESMFSNLLGGIGYFYGDAIVDRSYATEYDEENEGFWEETEAARHRAQFTQENPTELFSSVPSRPFFPRGFLWDEGFHLIPIAEYDTDLAMQIVESWFNLIDEEGWIAREQILGPEARSKVPQEFQVQYPHYANPPTLFLIVDTLVTKISSGTLRAAESNNLKSRLENLYPLLTRHYNWLRRTQFGDIKSYDREASSAKEAYRWRGRTPRHILTSGLDDYPRPQPPHPGELHLDLISWVGMVSNSLSNLAALLGEMDEAKTFDSQYRAIKKNIDDLHWSSKEKTYCDATIDDYEEHVHVCHKGYISLFPFMTGLLAPTHPNLPKVLDMISDPSHLWSDYGIRSLSQEDEFYGTDENYWRSPIWVNMNYLIIRSLLNVATSKDAPKAVKDQATKIYTDLRKNLVENVVHQWKDTGFAWEQYNPETGKGQRTQHFTGWTSLVVTIMSMPDLAGGAGISHGEL